jgi:hypothetical protein
MSREEIALRKHLDGALSRWRRKRAEARGVDIQVILPGHCTGPLVGVLSRYGDDEEMLREALHYVRGLGSKRIGRYGREWIALAKEAREVLDDERDDLAEDSYPKATTAPEAED